MDMSAHNGATLDYFFGVCCCCGKTLTGRNARDVACLYCILNGHLDHEVDDPPWTAKCTEKKT